MDLDRPVGGIDLYHPLAPDTEPPVRLFGSPRSGTTSSITGNQPQQPGLHCLNPPSVYHRRHHSNPTKSTTTTRADLHFYPSSSSSNDLPPQIYPGKINPLLPPPLPGPQPTRQISFPRPGRRRLSVILEPTAVHLPPSPPAEFDFSAFENPPPQLTSSSSIQYNLLDDSPCMSNFDHLANEDLSGRPLIDLTDEEESVGRGKSQHSPKHWKPPSRTPYSHFTPLPSPVISEKPFLSSLLSSPLTDYLPNWYRNKTGSPAQDNKNVSVIGSELSEIIRSINESISNIETKPASSSPFQETTPVGQNSAAPPQPPSERSIKAAVERQTDPSSGGHTPRRQSSSRGQPKPASLHSSPDRGNRGEPAAALASTKRSHSRATSVHWSVHTSPAARSSTEPLTEAALRLHLLSDRILSGDDVSRSQVAPERPADVAPSPRPTDGESRVTRWEAGEPKDDELASLVESINQRNDARSQMLTGLLRAVSHGIQEHDREAEAETAMVRELGRARQRQLGELAGQECGGSQFSAPFGSPKRTPHPPASIRDDTFAPTLENFTHIHSRGPSLAGDMSANIREASVAASLRAHTLLDNIRAAASRATSAKAPTVAEVHSSGHIRDEDTARPLSGTNKAQSNRTAASLHQASAAPKPSAPASIRAQSHAPSNRISLAAPSNRAQSAAASARNPSRAPSLHDKSAVANSQNPSAAASRKAASVAGTTKAQSVAGSVKAPSVMGTTKATSVAGTAKAQSLAGITNATSIAGSNKAASIAGTVKAQSVAGNTKATSVAGTTKAKSVAGTTKANSVVGTVKALSAAGSVKAGSGTAAGSVRAGTIAGTILGSVPGSPAVVDEEAEAEEEQAPPGSVVSERPESIEPPSVAEQDAVEEDAEGQAAEEDAAEVTQPTGDEDPCNEPNPPSHVDENLPRSGPTTVVGSLAGEIIGGGPGEGSQIIVDGEEDHKPNMRRPLVPTTINPLGEWIRFGRAGFKFQILDASPDLEDPPHPPAKFP
ncbi:hypothetical protein PSTG_09613 [Puccinia striiformis f. sp. tritici PST-78]|uniref:Uncharacterized protein n=1 Tax=Puccinia striiformis f. sp. tritici PST-78 TaxID=1165861 RepID=A0A0L0VCM8_9BASI|nr:hypothetical protein PSTG_09613 [Puccinia striiformis f. sp. tritici PST-78]